MAWRSSSPRSANWPHMCRTGPSALSAGCPGTLSSPRPAGGSGEGRLRSWAGGRRSGRRRPRRGSAGGTRGQTTGRRSLRPPPRSRRWPAGPPPRRQPRGRRRFWSPAPGRHASTYPRAMVVQNQSDPWQTERSNRSARMRATVVLPAPGGPVRIEDGTGDHRPTVPAQWPTGSPASAAITPTARRQGARDGPAEPSSQRRGGQTRPATDGAAGQRDRGPGDRADRGRAGPVRKACAARGRPEPLEGAARRAGRRRTTVQTRPARQQPAAQAAAAYPPRRRSARPVPA